MTVKLFYFKQFQEVDGEFAYGIREFIPSDAGQYEKTIFAGERPKDLAYKVKEIIQEFSGYVSYQNQRIVTENTLPLDNYELKELESELERIMREDNVMMT